MPRSPAKPCNHPGCPLLTHGRFCLEHQRERRQVLDRERGSSAKRGYGHDWRKLRAAYIEENPLCVECASHGRTEAVEAVDHIKPHKGDDALRLDWNNLQSLCKICHDRKTAREDGRFGPSRGRGG